MPTTGARQRPEDGLSLRTLRAALICSSRHCCQPASRDQLSPDAIPRRLIRPAATQKLVDGAPTLQHFWPAADTSSKLGHNKRAPLLRASSNRLKWSISSNFNPLLGPFSSLMVRSSGEPSWRDVLPMLAELELAFGLELEYIRARILDPSFNIYFRANVLLVRPETWAEFKRILQNFAGFYRNLQPQTTRKAPIQRAFNAQVEQWALLSSSFPGAPIANKDTQQRLSTRDCPRETVLTSKTTDKCPPLC